MRVRGSEAAAGSLSDVWRFAVTPEQLRLLRELDDWQILGLVDSPDFWCRHIRDMQGVGSTRDPHRGETGVCRKTYPWGIAITPWGDYTSQLKVTDPAHVVTLTWRQITRWVESLTDTQRAEARRARMTRDREQQRSAVELLFASEPVDTELTLW